MNDIFKMAEQAYHALSIAETELKRLYKENAELKNSLNREWVGLTDDDIAELERENAMMRARNERLEKELAWTEGALNNAAAEVEKLRRYVEKNNE